MIAEKNVKRPMLRYHGGKFVLAPWIIGHFPAHRVYVEPFGGAGSVLLRKPRSYCEVWNDLCGEVVNLFRQARDNGEALREKIRLTPFARDEFFGSYEPSGDPLEQARRTVVRSFMGFGSNSHNKPTGFRNNSNRSGTTPAHDWANLPAAYEAIIDRLRGVVIENRDAMEVIDQHDSTTTLHYLDPPYVFSTRSDAKPDYRHEMTDDQHRELAGFIHGLNGMVVLSGYRSALYDELYSDFQRVERAALADGAAKRTECLWISPNVRRSGDFFI